VDKLLNNSLKFIYLAELFFEKESVFVPAVWKKTAYEGVGLDWWTIRGVVLGSPPPAIIS
jgi:hypothetical protein